MPKIDAGDLIEIGPKALTLVRLIADGGRLDSDGGKRYTRAETKAIAKAAGALLGELLDLAIPG